MKAFYKTLGFLSIALTVALAAPTVTLAEERLSLPSDSIIVADDFVALAANAMEVKDYRNALYQANKAIDLNPNQAEAYFIRGQAKLQLGQREGAIADLKQAASQYLKQNNRDGYQAAQKVLSDV
ncbi:hypothetical protein [Kamptonema sp. UHCC 0994]|uniref:hypothetical protein n=1 Tax=Kamptonema sp. UHCC 0994 TaxID=3031329 RepID=UPI0023B92A5B|nr:hypothetical protein [Kamptonema sp. UHCC 0994]MDF0555293.1 hypothetical protein [Kamptonema sp. UHCC 0994]